MSFLRPQFLWGILLVIPAIVYILIKIKKVIVGLGVFNSSSTSFGKKVKNAAIFRAIFFALAWAMLMICLSGPSWGVEAYSVQKSGSAVSLVFDVSYSMLAEDMPENVGKTRLAATKKYVTMLLEKIPEVSVSVVAVKGDGLLLSPLTDDKTQTALAIQYASPFIMTSMGTNIAKGLQTAVQAFPPQSAKAGTIVLFTDGQETTEGLKEAVQEALQYGISVAVVGVGMDYESLTFAGDGITPIKTALQEDKLKSMVFDISQKLKKYQEKILYVNIMEPGSAQKLLQIINPHFAKKTTSSLTYELRPVDRSTLFLILALVCFFCGFVLGELKLKGSSHLLCILFLPCVLFYTGCSPELTNAATILEGTLAYYRKDYERGTACFFDVIEKNKADNILIANYGRIGLSSLYIRQGEFDAALEQLQQISSDAPENILFTQQYNEGLCHFNTNEFALAAKKFRKALMLKPEDLDTKINLELSLQGFSHEQEIKTQQGMVQEGKNSGKGILDDTIFSILKEREQKQWKSIEQEQRNNSALDY